MLEACHLYCDHGYVKICLKRVSSIVEYGEAIRKTSPSKLNQERWSNLRRSRSSLSTSSGMLKEKIKIVIIHLKWNAQGKGMIVLGFLFTGLMVLVVRPGYRIGSRTIKRGSWVSNLIVSFGESSNLCILGIIFLGSHLGFIHVRFYSLWLFAWQALAHQKRISHETLIAFLLFGGFTGSSL
jgi:hypothetical protein